MIRTAPMATISTILLLATICTSNAVPIGNHSVDIHHQSLLAEQKFTKGHLTAPIPIKMAVEENWPGRSADDQVILHRSSNGQHINQYRSDGDQINRQRSSNGQQINQYRSDGDHIKPYRSADGDTIDSYRSPAERINPDRSDEGEINPQRSADDHINRHRSVDGHVISPYRPAENQINPERSVNHYKISPYRSVDEKINQRQSVDNHLQRSAEHKINLNGPVSDEHVTNQYRSALDICSPNPCVSGSFCLNCANHNCTNQTTKDHLCLCPQGEIWKKCDEPVKEMINSTTKPTAKVPENICAFVHICKFGSCAPTAVYPGYECKCDDKHTGANCDWDTFDVFLMAFGIPLGIGVLLFCGWLIFCSPK